MNYLLVENRQSGNPIVHLGPIEWKPRLIQSELNDLGVYDNVPLPPIGMGYIKVTDNLEIIPITEVTDPNHDALHEELAGPFYTYGEQSATMYYNKFDRKLEDVKQSYKNIIAAQRYEKENSGVDFDLNGTTVKLPTDRNSRLQYSHLVSSIGDSTISWKFNTGFIDITKVDAQNILQAITNHVQAQFDWEKSQGELVDTHTELTTLKNSDI